MALLLNYILANDVRDFLVFALNFQNSQYKNCYPSGFEECRHSAYCQHKEMPCYAQGFAGHFSVLYFMKCCALRSFIRSEEVEAGRFALPSEKVDWKTSTALAPLITFELKKEQNNPKVSPFNFPAKSEEFLR